MGIAVCKKTIISTKIKVIGFFINSPGSDFSLYSPGQVLYNRN